MKHLKKWLALTLAAVLVMGMLPSLPHAQAEEIPEAEQDIRAEQPQPEEPAAEEPAAEESEPESGTWTWVNPALPEDMVPNAQIPSAEPMGIPNAEPQEEQKPVKEEKAAEELRKMLRNRSGPIYLEVYSDIREPYEFMDHLVNLATEPTGDPHDGDYLRWSIGQIGFSYILNYWGYEIMIDATYLLTEDQEAEMDGAISRAVRNLDVSSNSNYEKIFAVYDYLCDKVAYLEPSEENEVVSYTAYGALMNKEATSHGFAVLANRMLLELGVDNRVVGGAVGEYEHLWNVV
ncbi:MAG: transglutaminase domain-containing protein [Oscillospiraceae bacterium]|nr:transglutaminase domain-containing protein [Oscillospiraceae bacterium]